MEIVSIDITVFDALIYNLDALLDEVEIIGNTSDYMLQDWLDSQDVCEILDVSKKTLQRYRGSGKIPYTQIENKIYYKPADVEIFIKATQK